MALMTLHDLYTFHTIDRELFFILISPLGRELSQSLIVMTLWLWLEQYAGYPNFIKKLLYSNSSIINQIANEAVLCLESLEADEPPNESNTLIQTSILLRKNINIRLLIRVRYTLISGIKRILSTLTSHIFSDLILAKMVEQGFSLKNLVINQPVGVFGFPHSLFGGLYVIPRMLDYTFPIQAIWGWGAEFFVPEDDRTMFLTFSRGFPVDDNEVREFFTNMYGDCVEHLYMQQNGSSSTNPDTNNDQPLFARLVLRYLITVDLILCGRRISKFRVNGKHIWARKYERRD